MHAITQSTGTIDYIKHILNTLTNHSNAVTRPSFNITLTPSIPGALPIFVSFNALFTSSLVIFHSFSSPITSILTPPAATISPSLSSCTFSNSSKYSVHLFLASFPFSYLPFTLIHLSLLSSLLSKIYFYSPHTTY